MKKYMIVTCYGTYLYRWIDGTFYHVNRHEYAPNVHISLDDEGHYSFEDSDGRFYGNVAASDVTIETRDLSSTELSFNISNDGYLCAEPGGVFSKKPWRKGNEIFSLVPADGKILNAEHTKTLVYHQRKFTIPKLIHQTHPNYIMAPPLRKNMENIKTSNAGWSHRLWSDKDIYDFIYDSYGFDVLNSFLHINPRYGAARADLFRYLCIYKYGGVYLDIKASLEATLELDHFARGPVPAFTLG